MKTTELINRLMESVLKFGDQPVVAEMKIMDQGEPLMGKRVQLQIDAQADSTCFSFQFQGIPMSPPQPTELHHL